MSLNYIKNPITGQDIPLYSLQGKNLLQNYLRVYKFHLNQKGGVADYELHDDKNEYNQPESDTKCLNCDSDVKEKQEIKKPFQKIRDLTQELFKPSIEIQQNSTALNVAPNPNPNRNPNDHRDQKEIKTKSELLRKASVSTM